MSEKLIIVSCLPNIYFSSGIASHSACYKERYQISYIYLDLMSRDKCLNISYFRSFYEWDDYVIR